jgi:hypothetical protein
MKAANVASDPSDLFPKARSHSALRQIPIEDRWFVRRHRQLRVSQLTALVRSMDDALNNTSVILMIEAGSKKFVFPGDAQWENWELALHENADQLKNVDVYKVGHHGSLNATPKTLWNGFTRKSTTNGAPGRLVTVMSTRSNSKHGSEDNDSEVPRSKLVDELKLRSLHRSTQELEPNGDLVLTIDFDL